MTLPRAMPFSSDLGIHLAKALRDYFGTHPQIRLLKPAQTLHATVLGAGAHIVQLSGSTTYFRSQSGPLRNLPIVALDSHPDEESPSALLKLWLAARRLYDSDSLVAYWLSPQPMITFDRINCLAKLLLRIMDDYPQHPAVVLTHDNIGKALGQAICYHGKGMEIICLDEIDAGEGDFIDIGTPLPGQDTVPVIIKTLAFNVNRYSRGDEDKL